MPRCVISAVVAAFAFVAAALSWPASASAQMPWPYDCTGDARAFAERELAKSVPAAQLQTEKLAAEKVLAQLQQLRAAFERGEDLEPPYRAAARLRRLSLGATDPELADLYRRAAADQFARLHLYVVMSRIGWAADVSEGARRFAFAVAAAQDWCGVDEANAAWLEARINSKGWFKISAYGEVANGAAFILALHADTNRPLQRRVLAMLEPLVATGDVRPQDYAQLSDRIAIGEDRPQRFGTQGRCTAPGTWTEFPVEDPPALEQRRTEVGLPPMAAYRARFVQGCQ